MSKLSFNSTLPLRDKTIGHPQRQRDRKREGKRGKEREGEEEREVVRNSELQSNFATKTCFDLKYRFH